jgi:hypothetical protein
VLVGQVARLNAHQSHLGGFFGDLAFAVKLCGPEPLGCRASEYCFVIYMQESGSGLLSLGDAWYVNGSTRGLMWNLTIATIAFTLWILARVSVWRNLVSLWDIAATFTIGVSCGLPLYLFLRTKAVT